jgi:hypothetical protein
MKPETLRQLLSYNPDTGSLIWLPRDDSWFKKPSDAKRWNSRYAHTKAFTTKIKGYLKGCILEKDYYAHRVCWALHHEKWPEFQVDHINGNREDNRIKNLRDVDCLENQKNLALRGDNKAGRIGVSWNSQESKWVASITVNRKWIFLGRYRDVNLAVAARKAAEDLYGYHKNHGRIRSVQS